MSGPFGWFDRLPARDRRALMLGLAILGPALFFVWGVQPFGAELADARERLTTERELLGRELALIRSGPDLPGEIEHMRRKAEAADTRMVHAPSTVLAESVLIDRLEVTAARSRVLLENIRSAQLPRGEEAPPGLEVVRLTVNGESDLQGVLTFLDGVEGNEFFLRVRGLALEPQMSRPEGGNGNGNNRAPPRPTGVVEFQLIVDGFARIAETSDNL